MLLFPDGGESRDVTQRVMPINLIAENHLWELDDTP